MVGRGTRTRDACQCGEAWGGSGERSTRVTRDAWRRLVGGAIGRPTLLPASPVLLEQLTVT
jgi:hypothetical protein